MVVRHCKITSQEFLTDPYCAPESARSVSTSWTGSHARDGVVTLRENLRMPLKRLRFSYDIQKMH